MTVVKSILLLLWSRQSHFCNLEVAQGRDPTFFFHLKSFELWLFYELISLQTKNIFSFQAHQESLLNIEALGTQLLFYLLLYLLRCKTDVVYNAETFEGRQAYKICLCFGIKINQIEVVMLILQTFLVQEWSSVKNTLFVGGVCLFWSFMFASCRGQDENSLCECSPTCLRHFVTEQ